MLFLKILLGLAILNVAVLVHELGHLIAAKRFRVPVEVFSIGMGPAIVSRTWGETRYQLSWIPIGGYNRFKTPDLPESDNAVEHFGLYGRTSPLGTIIITLSGIVANYVLSFIALVSAYLVQGAGFVRALLDSGQFLWTSTIQTFALLPHAFANTVSSHPDPEQSLSGPVGIVHVATSYIHSGATLLAVVAAISLALGLTNLLPLPVLDGGQCLFGLVQHLRRRPFSSRTKTMLLAGSAGLLVGVLVLVTFNDIAALF